MNGNDYGAALEQIGTRLASYPALQESYNARIHGPDFRAFSSLWETSLYEPIRRFVAEGLAGSGASELLYCAPGSHAPLLQSGDDGSLARHFERIGLLDIDQSALASAATVARASSPATKVEMLELDFSGGFGQRLCGLYADALREAATPSEVADRLGDPSERAKALFRDAGETAAALSAQIVRSLGEHPRGLLVSEMMAAFTATPAFLAFRSELFRRHGRASGEALDRAGRLWQAFNDHFLDFHLTTLRPRLGTGSGLVIAFDTQKIFDDPSLGPIASFSPGFSFSGAFRKRRLELRRRTEAVWLDHPVDFEANVHGVPVDDFKAHRHAIQIFALAAVV